MKTTFKTVDGREIPVTEVVEILVSYEEQKVIEDRANKLITLLEANDYELLMALDEELFPKYIRWDADDYTMEELESLISKAIKAA